MKRDENLHPLSWQHHNGLMAVLLLKKGVQKEADVKAMNEFINQIRKDELDEHFEAEETVLAEYAETYPQLKALFNKMKEEHLAIRNCYKELLYPSYAVIEKFYTLLEKHIRFEERELFPLIEETLSAGELQMAGKKLNHLHHQSCANFPVKFWE
jgi:hemerythrin-like domain-containing protein